MGPKHEDSDAPKTFLGVPVALFKSPVAMLLLGFTLTQAVTFGMGKVSDVIPTQSLGDIQKDIQSLKEDRAETKAQVAGLKEQATRIETKLDRLLERSAYQAARR
jgi:hypothetical protein